MLLYFFQSFSALSYTASIICDLIYSINSRLIFSFSFLLELASLHEWFTSWLIDSPTHLSISLFNLWLTLAFFIKNLVCGHCTQKHTNTLFLSLTNTHTLSLTHIQVETPIHIPLIAEALSFVCDCLKDVIDMVK